MMKSLVRTAGLRVAVLSTGALLTALAGSASAIPVGWTCIGSCGTLGANGVVTDPPGTPTTYEYVTTNGGIALGTQDLNLGAETNGSILRSILFAGASGDALEFDFNYVTSDGAGFADYAWARLLQPDLSTVALLFTARTTPGGNTAPGFGMPANSATLTPPATPIIPGGPAWLPLGGSSGACFAAGCGYTGWIHSSFNLPATGNYILEFGTVNWSDTAFQSGLALSGTTVAGVPITPAPEPATIALLGLGAVLARRRMRA